MTNVHKWEINCNIDGVIYMWDYTKPVYCPNDPNHEIYHTSTKITTSIDTSNQPDELYFMVDKNGTEIAYNYDGEIVHSKNLV